MPESRRNDDGFQPCKVCGIPSMRATHNPDRTCIGCCPTDVRFPPGSRSTDG